MKLHGLTAVIQHQKNQTNRKVRSHIYIAIKGDTHNIGVASAFKGGRWNEEQALKEFKNNPTSFQIIEAGADMAAALNL